MVEVVTIKKRDIAVDFVKVIATLLVLNSHMGICYGSHSALATGGGIGDACSSSSRASLSLWEGRWIS